MSSIALYKTCLAFAVFICIFILVGLFTLPIFLLGKSHISGFFHYKSITVSFKENTYFSF